MSKRKNNKQQISDCRHCANKADIENLKLFILNNNQTVINMLHTLSLDILKSKIEIKEAMWKQEDKIIDATRKKWL